MIQKFHSGMSLAKTGVPDTQRATPVGRSPAWSPLLNHQLSGTVLVSLSLSLPLRPLKISYSDNLARDGLQWIGEKSEFFWYILHVQRPTSGWLDVPSYLHLRLQHPRSDQQPRLQ